MLLFRSTVWIFAALLSFTSLVLSRGVDPIEDFCSLTAYMSRASSNLLKGFIRFLLTESWSM